MDKENLIIEIQNNIKICKKCRLHEHATNAVPGEGNINSSVIFIGEAPGYYEDASGRPFVGRAGKLLESSLNDIGYKREDIWIGNVIKHRPPENREPLPDEILACKPFLDMQLEAIKPKMIVTLGRFAMNYFYPEGKISRDRGNLIKTGRYAVYPIYHPAAALRSSGMMQSFKDDFKKIPQMLEMVDKVMTSETSQEEIDDGQLGLGL